MSALLAIENLSLSYQQRGQWREVVHNVSFTLQAGEMVALVGESGSGKTTTAQAIIGLLAENGRRDSGKIVLNGTDIADWSAKRMDSLRGVSISLVPQDPGNSLNPVKTIGDQVGEMLQLHQKISKSERQQRVLELLEKVGLSHPQQRLTQYPHQLSGGMKQRVLIAIALALRPQIIIADEPTSALDVTVQKRILDLLDVLRRESGTAVLFVTHDLALAAERADRLLVFRHGEIQEQGPAAQRELAATVVSKVNGCIFCASVHARKASQLSKDDAAVQKLLNVAPGAELAHGQSPRWAAISDLVATLSITPAAASLQQVQTLRDQGLSTLELLDVIQSAAFFAWANRLMLTLGEPFLPEQSQG
uniref:ABC transporter domain-containing protein n=1 Tax=Acyrthosiphon pisum TaxID=7029 RepID=A0A8R2D7N3_ACYPI|eukprot:XP_016664182.1 PREDICTED: dipeptide transport ATP-binding protein DppD-like [Acyrthosiphon pisum]